MSAAIMKSIKHTTTTNFVSLCIFRLKNNFEIKIRDNQTGDDLKKEIIKKITSNKENQEKIQNSIFIKFLGGKKIDDKKTIKDNGLESDSILSVNLCILGGVRWCPIKLEHTTYGAGDYDRSCGKYEWKAGYGYSDGTGGWSSSSLNATYSSGGYSTTGKVKSNSNSYDNSYSNGYCNTYSNGSYSDSYSRTAYTNGLGYSYPSDGYAAAHANGGYSSSKGYSSSSGGYSSSSGGYSSSSGGYSSGGYSSGGYSSGGYSSGGYSYPSSRNYSADRGGGYKRGEYPQNRYKNGWTNPGKGGDYGGYYNYQTDATDAWREAEKFIQTRDSRW